MATPNIDKVYNAYLIHKHIVENKSLTPDEIILNPLRALTSAELYFTIHNENTVQPGDPSHRVQSYIQLFHNYKSQFDLKSSDLLMSRLSESLCVSDCQRSNSEGVEVLIELAELILKSGKLKKLNLEQLSNMLSNFSRVDIFHAETFDKIFKKILEHDKIGYSSCANIARSVSELRLKPKKFLDHLALNCLRNKKTMRLDKLADIAWSFAHVNHMHERLFINLADKFLEIFERTQSISAQHQRSFGHLCIAYSIFNNFEGSLSQALWDTAVTLYERHFLGKDGKPKDPDNVTLSQIAHAGIALGRNPTPYMLEAIHATRRDAHITISSHEDIIATILSNNSYAFNRQFPFYGYILDFRLQLKRNGETINVALEYNGKEYHHIRNSEQLAEKELGNFLLKRKVLAAKGYKLLVVNQDQFGNLSHREKSDFICKMLKSV